VISWRRDKFRTAIREVFAILGVLFSGHPDHAAEEVE
jgi:hypothetical protein